MKFGEVMPLSGGTGTRCWRNPQRGLKIEVVFSLSNYCEPSVYHFVEWLDTLYHSFTFNKPKNHSSNCICKVSQILWEKQ